jgi:Tol biopolymer transport system component
MAYVSGAQAQEIMEVSIDSGAVGPLRATRTIQHSAHYAPSGDQYVYADYSTGRSEIMLRDVAGSRATQLTFGNPVAGSNQILTRNTPRFSPDGRRIAFSQSGQIWTMPATGGESVAITPKGESYGAPSWSPDSHWIAFIRNSAGNGELTKIDSAGQGQPVRLCDQSLSNNVSWFTRWSAAGRIAYAGRGGVRLCGENETSSRLLAPGAIAGDFNRKGDLFYALKREGEEWDLLTLEVASGRVLRTIKIDESPRANLRDASLHPDGKRLTYNRTATNFDIWLLDGLPRPATGWTTLFRHWIEP